MIDIMSVDGLLDMIAVGNIIEFANALDHRSYSNDIVDADEYLEREAAITRYHTFIAWFSDRFGLLINGSTWVNPSYLFKRRLISFGATLGEYVTHEHSIVQKLDHIDGFSHGAVKRKIRKHIQHIWPGLLPAFDNLVTAPSQFLYHTGFSFKIIEKTPLCLAAAKVNNHVELIDYADAPIYIMAPEEARNVVPPSSSHVAAKRDRVITSQTSSPSKSQAAKRRK
jgi:hypothetical protein